MESRLQVLLGPLRLRALCVVMRWKMSMEQSKKMSTRRASNLDFSQTCWILQPVSDRVTGD